MLTDKPSTFRYHLEYVCYRELIDGECYEYAAEFLCSVLQPKCLQRPSLPADETKLPCRASCREFWAGCGDRLSERLKKLLDCFKFPEYSDFGRKCRPQPSKWSFLTFLYFNAFFVAILQKVRVNRTLIMKRTEHQIKNLCLLETIGTYSLRFKQIKHLCYLFNV